MLTQVQGATGVPAEEKDIMIPQPRDRVGYRAHPLTRPLHVSKMPHARRSIAALLAIVLGFAALTVAGASAQAATTRLEAENATRAGGAVVSTEHGGFSGTGFVGGYTDINRGSASTTFAVSTTSTGDHTLALRYANGTGSAKTITLVIDGAARQVSLPPTSNWATWATHSTVVGLSAGSHKVAYQFGSADSGNLNLDALDVTTPAGGSGGSDPSSGPLFEAETAARTGGTVVATDHPGFTGTGFVGGFTDGNRGAAAVTFSAQIGSAGDKSLALRYANGTGAAKTLSLYVDGVKARQISLAATANWATWATSTETITVGAGTRSITYRFDSADSGNVNIDSLTLSTATTPPVEPPVEPPVNPPVSGSGEAESAFLSGGTAIASATAGYAGTGYVTGFQTPGARVIRTVNVASAGTATVTVRFSNSSGSNRVLAVVINGREAGSVTLSSGSGWRTAVVSVPTRAGLNTVALVGTSATGGDVLIDSLVLSGEGALASRGATTSYVQYEAEEGSTTGSSLAASRTYGTVQAEASGRRTVRLDATGEKVSVTLTQPASGIVLRYSIPDTANGAGQTAPLAIYANGTKVKDVTLSSQFSWLYGGYPFDNNPSGTTPHRFFDETRTEIGSWPAGTVLTLQKDASSTAAWYDIDLIEAESVPGALSAPAGALSITSYGAVSGGADATSAIGATIAAAKSQGKPVWIPAGTFRINSTISVSDVKIYGAGPWHSVLQGTNSRGGFLANGSNVTIADLAIFGDAKLRQDDASDAAIEGNFGSGSMLHNIWVQHTKVGLWVVTGTDGLYATALRIRDTYADGVNFRSNVKNSRVDQSTFRNTGDDSLAMWSDGTAVTDSAFTFNTVQAPALSNGIAIYGGTSNRAEDNIVADTVNAAAGIAISTRFGIPFSGTTSVQRNSLIRTGSLEPNWNAQLGALWIYADVHAIDARIVLRDLTISDSTYSGILMSWQKSIRQLEFDRVSVAGSGAYGIEINATGSASISNTSISSSRTGALFNGLGYTLVRGSGNTGF